MSQFPPHEQQRQDATPTMIGMLGKHSPTRLIRATSADGHRRHACRGPVAGALAFLEGAEETRGWRGSDGLKSYVML